MKYILRMLDLNRILNNLFGKVNVYYGEPLPEGGTKLPENPEDTIVTIVVKPFLGKSTGIGMKIDSLMQVMSNIVSIPKEQYYDAEMIMRHPDNHALQFHLEAWAIPKLFKVAHPACASYALLQMSNSFTNMLKEVENASSTETSEEAPQEDKPTLH
jgi:hypothetical protein